MHFIEQKRDSYLTVPLVFAKHDETEIRQSFIAEATKRFRAAKAITVCNSGP